MPRGLRAVLYLHTLRDCLVVSRCLDTFTNKILTSKYTVESKSWIASNSVALVIYRFKLVITCRLEH